MNKLDQFFDRPDAGRLLLRLLLGGLMLFHGWFKLNHGVAWIEPILVAHHLPGFIAWGALIGEIVAPILIILGLWIRFSALIYVINMLFAIFLVAGAQFWSITSVGAWALETEMLYLFGGLVIMLMGAGKYRIGR